MSGIGNTAAFQRSGTPLCVTAGATSLKRVSRAITVSAVGGDTTIAFGGDVTTMTIPSGQTIRLEVRCLDFTLGVNGSAVVELTDITSNSLAAGTLDIVRDELV